MSPQLDQDKKDRVDSYLKYSSLAIQLLAAIGFFGWLGFKIDQYLGIKFPAFMLLLGIMAFAGMMFQLYRSLNKKD